MKLKILLCALFLPLLVHAANTNVFNHVLIRNDFQFIGGTPGVGKVLSSDSSGFSSWTTPAASGAVTNAVNIFTTNQIFSSGTKFIQTITGFGGATAAQDWLVTNTVSSGTVRVYANDANSMDLTIARDASAGSINIEAYQGNRSIFTVNGFSSLDQTAGVLKVGSGSTATILGAAGQTVTIGAAGAATKGHQTATAALNWAAMVNVGDTETNTIAVTSASIGDTVIINPSMDAFSHFLGDVVGSGSVVVRRTADVALAIGNTNTFRATVIRY